MSRRAPRQNSGASKAMCHMKFVGGLLLLAAFVEAQQQIPTVNHHDQANFGLYSPQSQQHTNNRLGAGTSTSARTPRVGLAPQERPACQLQPLSAQKRRHLAATSTTMTGESPNTPVLASPNPANSTTSQYNNEFISVPKLGPLGQQSGIRSNSSDSTPAGPGQRVKQKVDTSERLRQLRQLLVSNNYDAYLVGPNDEHGSEYVSNYDRRLRFISGFTGSNGLALVLLDRAVLFTDGRYALQADADLDCNWWLVVGDEPLADLQLWLRAQGAKGLKVATDARLMSLQSFDYLEEQLKKLDQSEFALISQDLVDVVWDNHASEVSNRAGEVRDRPAGKLVVQPLEFAGQVSWQEKLLRLVQEMERLKARHYVISKLDDIAWLLNLRGSDIPLSPLFKAYLLVARYPNNANAITSTNSLTHLTTVADFGQTKSPVSSVDQLLEASVAPKDNNEQSPISLQAPQVLQVPASQTIRVTFYVDLKKVTGQVREHLHLDNGTSIQTPDGLHHRIQVELKDYDVFIMDFRDKFGQSANKFVGALQASSGKLLLDAMSNVAIHVLAKNYDDRLILVEPLLQRLKSVKSEHEVAGMRLAHWRDSLAISMLLAQLEQDIGVMRRLDRWTEAGAARELEFYRSLMDFNRGQSFDTISAYGSNGAIVHYRPPNVEDLDVEHRLIGNKSTFLLDSGGQYLDGTTDITRTLHFGRPTDFQRETYTRVLMGAVDIMSLVFQQSSRSPSRLDDLMARRHLMDIGLDYAHGTGHGIGAFSMVHEEPALIRYYASTLAAGQQSAKQNKFGAGQSTVLNEPLPIQANMFTSVEPGFYKSGDFGIRLENIVVTQRVEPAPTGANQSGRAGTASTWLRLEPISLVPFEPKLIKFELLSNKQKAWLNSYNLMVRLRMTQQINHYLTKISQQSADEPSANQIAGGASANVRLYQQLLKDKNATSSEEAGESSGHAFGTNNYQKLDSKKLQQLLEQAHRWIMSKTELIPLDVQQQMVAANCTSGPEGGQPAARLKQAQRADRDEWSALGADPKGQRLMLAYMSSMPFNDADAARAVATLSARTDPVKSNNSSAASFTQSPNTSSSTTTTNQWGQKCTGIECDLLLLEALNSHQQSLNELRRQQAQRGDIDTIESKGNSPLGSSSSSLMDVFQLNASPDSSIWPLSMDGVWPVLGLAMLLTLQLAVMAYVCVGGRKSGPASSATSGSELGARSCSQQAGAGAGAGASGTQLILTPADGRRRDSSGHLSSSLIGGAPLSVVVTPTDG